MQTCACSAQFVRRKGDRNRPHTINAAASHVLQPAVRPSLSTGAINDAGGGGRGGSTSGPVLIFAGVIQRRSCPRPKGPQRGRRRRRWTPQARHRQRCSWRRRGSSRSSCSSQVELASIAEKPCACGSPTPKPALQLRDGVWFVSVCLQQAALAATCSSSNNVRWPRSACQCVQNDNAGQLSFGGCSHV